MRSHVTIKQAYRNSWIMAATVAFLLVMALHACRLNGQDMPPLPPGLKLPSKTVNPDYMLLSPHAVSSYTDAAMASRTTSPDPSAAKFDDPTNLLRSASMEKTNLGEYAVLDIGATNFESLGAGYIIQASTNNVDWEDFADSALAGNIICVLQTNYPCKLFFRVKPKQ